MARYFLIGALMTLVINQAVASEPWRADPALVAKSSASQREFIYDESQVPEYTLPDPLRMSSGEAVANASQWAARREETMELFRAHVYGRRPQLECKVTFTTTAEKHGLFGVDALGRSLTVTITSGSESYSFPMLVFMPMQVTQSDRNNGRPYPAVVQINNQEFPTLEDAATTEAGFWPVKDLMRRGYVACAVSTHAIDPDRADGFDQGVRGFFRRTSAEPNQPLTDDDWKSLSAWGWGASRALDYLLTLEQVDKTKISLIGHSRGGKAALWAAAEDPRFAIVCSNNSGCGGAALSRRAYGETVARITKSFPHWFCDRFATYAGNEAKLPIDQHQLFSLIAPRPVYVTSASDDLWADPRGEYLSLVAASPVYQLLGQRAIINVEVPAVDEPRVEGKMGYHIRTGGHGLTAYDWEKFLDFCDMQWSR